MKIDLNHLDTPPPARASWNWPLLVGLLIGAAIVWGSR